MSTWLSWCVKAPVLVSGYDGYPNDPDRTLAEILYVVNHSAEGNEAFLKKGHRPNANPALRASWTFSNCLNGTMYQHFPLEAITYTSGGYTQNLQGVGAEHEGFAGTPINDLQVQNDLHLWNDLESLCPNLRAQKKGEGYREHGELTNGATACPSGRIQPLYDAPIQEDDVTKIIFDGSNYYALSGFGRMFLGVKDANGTVVDNGKTAGDLLIANGIATNGGAMAGTDLYKIPALEATIMQSVVTVLRAGTNANPEPI